MNFKLWLLNENALPPQLTVYHGGANFQDFNFDNIGTGEGSRNMITPPLGPGIYFSDCESIAIRYTKYAPKKAALHSAKLNTKGIYNLMDYNKDYDQAQNAIMEELGLSENERWIRNYGVYRGLFKILPFKEAQQTLIKHGINGIYENLPEGCLEISVINLNNIKKIKAIRYDPKTMKQMNPER